MDCKVGALLLACLIAGASQEIQGQVSLVQSAAHDNGAGSLSTCTASFGSANTAGNLIVVAVEIGATATDRQATITDTQGNTYVPAMSQVTWRTVGGGSSAQIFYAANIKGGANTVTMTLAGGATAWNQIEIHEYSGLATSSPLDVTASAFGTTGTTPFTASSGSAVTTSSGELIFGYGNGIGANFSQGPGFTVRQTTAGTSEDMVQTTAGSISATEVTQVGGTAYVMLMATFRPGDSIPPSVPTGLAATAVSAAQINLSWNASSDPNSTVAGYKVYRNGTQVGTTANTNYQDSGLNASTSYSYTVAAYDPAGNTSAQSTSASATTMADTTPPTVPSGLVATAISSSQINLSWNASTDPGGAVAGYKVYRNGTQVGTAAGTAYQDSSLSASTTYSYTVAAYDAAGNTSAQSTSASATTQASSSGTVQLVQSAAQNNGAASLATCTASFGSANTAGNLIVVAAEIGATATDRQATITDTQGNTYVPAMSQVTWRTVGGGSSAQIFYAANIKGGANTVTMTLAGGATAWNQIEIHEYSGLATSSPLDVTASAFGTTGTTPFTASSGPAVTTSSGELIFGYGNGIGASLSQGAGFTVRQNTAGTSEDMVQATAGSISATEVTQVGGTAYVMLMAAFRRGDTTPPSVPTGLVATAVSSSQINLSWNASTDPNSTVAGYKIYRNGTQVGTTANTSYQDSGLSASTTYSYTVSAYDPSGNTSAQSSSASATTQAPDTTPPSVPTGLAATAVSAAQISLSWNASTDNSGVVAGYKVYRNGTQVGTTANANYQDSGLSASTSYSYTVAAYDSSGNTSAQSTSASATTMADTTPPTVPSGLAATAISSSQINLSWNALSDSGGAVAGYKVYRNGTQVGTTAGTTYQDTSLSASTTYSYTVAAYDAAGNTSAQSSSASATTQASSSGTIHLVQSAFQDNGAADLPFCTTTFQFPNTAGNTIMVAVEVGAAADSEHHATIHDTQGNNYYPATPQVTWRTSGGGSSAQIFYAPNVKPGPNTVTLTEWGGDGGAGNAWNQIQVHEYSGLSIASPLDTFATAFGVTANAPATVSVGPMTTALPGELVFAYGNTIGGAMAPGNGFTQRLNQGGTSEDMIQAAAGPVTATEVDPFSATPYVLLMAAFKPSNSTAQLALPAQPNYNIAPLTTLTVTNTAAEVDLTPRTTNSILFNYQNRAALLADGWSYLATNPNGSARNTEITNPALGAVVSYDQAAHPGVLRIPCDSGDLWGQFSNNTRNNLFRSLSSNWVSLQLTLLFPPTQDIQQVHFAVYQDDDNYVQAGFAYNSSLGGQVISIISEVNGQPNHYFTGTYWLTGGPHTPPATNMHFRLDRDPATTVVSVFGSLNATDWAFIGSFPQALQSPRISIWAGGSSSGFPAFDVQRLDIVTDQPQPVFAYQLQNPPSGASIDNKGVIRWTPTAAQVGTYALQTIVTDNSTPSLSATNTFSVAVTSGANIAANNNPGTSAVAFEYRAAEGTCRLTFSGAGEQRFEIQWAESPTGPWNHFGDVVADTSGHAMFEARPPSASMAFFRVIAN